MIILIDNYDSFTYNLVQYLGVLDSDIRVIRNDECRADDILAQKPDSLVISPGPCTPDEAGICLALIQKVAQTDIPLLGVCLGHQAIGQAFGGKIIKAPAPIHGKTSLIHHTEKGLYEGVLNPAIVTRYHSLLIERETCPDSLEITATTENDLIMSIAHKTKPIFGVQYHPESIATEQGLQLIKNFIKRSAS